MTERAKRPVKARGWLIAAIFAGGCLLLMAFVAGIFWLVFSMMKSSDAYVDAVARARADPRVIARLGTPIEEGWFVTGTVSLQNDSGHANLSIPVSGPRGSGQLDVVARKTAGKWSFQRLVCQPDRGISIDLLQPAEALPDEAP